LVIFIIFHLFTNAQAALWFGQDGRSYIQSVNAIQDMPFIEIAEVLLVALPLLIHALFGIRYLRTGEMNSFGYDGAHPYLPEYSRNRAYTWQRITSWILLVGITFHVAHMRFVEQPVQVGWGLKPQYLIRLTPDSGLLSVSQRLDVDLLHAGDISQNWAKDLARKPLRAGQILALTPDYGTAELLMVRDAFKSPLIMLIYTILVLAACFHAFNGLWTFLITWGISLSNLSQRWMLYLSTLLLGVTAFLGLVTIFGTYWINLRH
jgi:succinate dehydrogenase / fumarate reductase cytochrome b subunit